jgi:hypothetical protein
MFARNFTFVLSLFLSLANGNDGSSWGDGPIPPALGRTDAAG